LRPRKEDRLSISGIPDIQQFFPSAIPPSSIMRAFSEAHRAVHFPPDRRFRIHIRPKEALVIMLVVVIPIALAWIQFLVFGLPSVSVSPPRALPDQPHGFPAWIRLTHFCELLFLDAPRSKRSVDFDGPSATLLEPQLHA
jgi:hypothetical protein